MYQVVKEMIDKMGYSVSSFIPVELKLLSLRYNNESFNLIKKKTFL